MNLGILLPGFSANGDDWAIPVQQNLVRELAQQDDVRVIAMRYPHRTTPYQIKKATVYPLGVGAWTRGWRRLKLWWDTWRLLRALHQEKPFDVLHAMWADETGLVAAWAGSWLNIPVVVSIAGGELVGFEDIDYGLQRGRFSRWVVGQALNGADVVTAPCTYTRDLIQQADYHLSTDKVHIVTLGVDTNVFRPVDTQSANNRLIHVASLVSVKGQQTLLKAIAQLKGVTLDIIGEGVLASDLKATAETLGISERVNFIGKVEHLDLPKHYQQANLHILTSRHEALGMVTLEAAACGLPTISTDVGFLRDCPSMGVVTPVGDAAALATTIQVLLNDKSAHQQLRQSARQSVQNHYTIQHTTNKFRTLYQSMLINNSR